MIDFLLSFAALAVGIIIALGLAIYRENQRIRELTKQLAAQRLK